MSVQTCEVREGASGGKPFARSGSWEPEMGPTVGKIVTAPTESRILSAALS